ncbi:MAG: LuxR family transcriptional regulator [Burkholderiales bacterium]
MLERLRPGKASLRDRAYVPPLVAALVGAVDGGARLESCVESIVRHLGFDSLFCLASPIDKPDLRDGGFVYATLPGDWLDRYARMSYADVDPLVALAWEGAIPVPWDQASVRGRGPRSDACVDDALRHGIASGVCFASHGPRASRALIALHAGVARSDTLRQQAIARNLPDIVLFGHYFHELFVRPAVELASRPRAAAVPFSKRERACLELAAHGLTTGDIAVKLDISSRTVQFHFDSIRSKLGASNRQQAIAIAVHSGVVRAGQSPAAFTTDC